jgi:hypothetical protein
MIGTPDNVEFQAVSIARPQLAVTDVLFAGGIKIPEKSEQEGKLPPSRQSFPLLIELILQLGNLI